MLRIWSSLLDLIGFFGPSRAYLGESPEPDLGHEMDPNG